MRIITTEMDILQSELNEINNKLSDKQKELNKIKQQQNALKQEINNLQYQNKSILELQLLCHKSVQKNEQIEQIKPTFCKMQYLNEPCKDALNIDNFLKSIEITLENYINMEDSFVEGISKNLTQIITTSTKTSLPFCCTNLRDKVIWVKIDDNWVEDK